MSVSRYEGSIAQYSESTMKAALPSQFYENDLGIDYSIPGNRLHRRIDGTLEVTPKPPGVIIAEVVLKPLIDTTYAITTRTLQFVKDSFWCINQALSIPGAAAQSTKSFSTLEACVAQNLQEAYKATEIAIKENNPKMMEAAHKLYGPFFEQCFKDESFHKAQALHDKNLAVHREHYAKYEKALKACIDAQGVGNCYPYKLIECLPDLFPVEVSRSQDGQSVTSIDWKTSHGYLSWSIYISGWIKDGYYASGSYNYDTAHSKHTVSSRNEIESLHSSL